MQTRVEYIRAALLRLLDGSDPDLGHDIYAEGRRLEFPQSGERFVGKQNLLAWRRSYPADVGFAVRRVQCRCDQWIMETAIRYDGGEPSYRVSIHEFRDRQLVRETIRRR
ncbi:MAG: hypothetical protein L0H84_09105 [Pseudonocardia sp.]|nr:hypothetical protein [Pseudonocardia sp.]